jgi:hypothetical protein
VSQPSRLRSLPLGTLPTSRAERSAESSVSSTQGAPPQNASNPRSAVRPCLRTPGSRAIVCSLGFTRPPTIALSGSERAQSLGRSRQSSGRLAGPLGYPRLSPLCLDYAPRRAYAPSRPRSGWGKLHRCAGLRTLCRVTISLLSRQVVVTTATVTNGCLILERICRLLPPAKRVMP